MIFAHLQENDNVFYGKQFWPMIELIVHDSSIKCIEGKGKTKL